MFSYQNLAWNCVAGESFEKSAWNEKKEEGTTGSGTEKENKAEDEQNTGNKQEEGKENEEPKNELPDQMTDRHGKEIKPAGPPDASLCTDDLMEPDQLGSGKNVVVEQVAEEKKENKHKDHEEEEEDHEDEEEEDEDEDEHD